jgi:hypothetical protein
MHLIVPGTGWGDPGIGRVIGIIDKPPQSILDMRLQTSDARGGHSSGAASATAVMDSLQHGRWAIFGPHMLPSG